MDPTKMSDEKRGSFSYDPETGAPRRMSRISGPAPGTLRGRSSIGGPDEDLDVGKQIAMEENNAIKYRTCTWQKL